MGIFEPSPEKLVIVLIIALIVLGPKRLPEVGKSLGKGIREFKDGITDSHDEPEPPPPRLRPRASRRLRHPRPTRRRRRAIRSRPRPSSSGLSRWLVLAESIPRTSSP